MGLGASGTGDIAAFTATNTGTAPVTATITVTPHFANGGVTCDGEAKTFTITVNPTAQVEDITSQVVCNNTTTTAVNFTTNNTAGTTTYTWTNNTTSIGLGASGTGNIAAFTATNTGTAPVAATITVTPHFANDGETCDGESKTFTITVNPTVVMTDMANQTVCAGTNTAEVVFGTNLTGGVGTVSYEWTNTNPAIGLGASGTSNSIPAFAAANSTSDPISGTITVTPTYTNNGVECVGTPKNFTITVNPLPTLTVTPETQSICTGGQITAISITATNANTEVRDITITPNGGSETANIGSDGITGSESDRSYRPCARFGRRRDTLRRESHQQPDARMRHTECSCDDNPCRHP